MIPMSYELERIKTGRMGKLFPLPPQFWDDKRIGYSCFLNVIEGNPSMRPELPTQFKLNSEKVYSDLRPLIYPLWAWTHLSSMSEGEKPAQGGAELIAMAALQIGLRFITPDLPAGVGSRSKQSSGEFQNINVLGELEIIHDRLTKLTRGLRDSGADASLKMSYLRISSDGLTNFYIDFKEIHEGFESVFDLQYLSIIRAIGEEFGTSAVRTIREELERLEYKTFVTWEQFLDRIRHAHKSANAQAKQNDSQEGLWSHLQLPKPGRPKKAKK